MNVSSWPTRPCRICRGPPVSSHLWQSLLCSQAPILADIWLFLEKSRLSPASCFFPPHLSLFFPWLLTWLDLAPMVSVWRPVPQWGLPGPPYLKQTSPLCCLLLQHLVLFLRGTGEKLWFFGLFAYLCVISPCPLPCSDCKPHESRNSVNPCLSAQHMEGIQ